MRMILSLCIDTLKTHVSVRGYMFFCPCPETNIASIVSGQLFVHVSMVYDTVELHRHDSEFPVLKFHNNEGLSL